MIKNISKLIFVLLALFILYGCSGSGNPTIPSGSESTAKLNNITYNSLPVGVSDYSADGKPTAGYGALGLFNVHLDKTSLTGDITSLRSAGSTDVLEIVDITNFLRMAPCTNCVKLMNVSLDADSHLVAKIGIRHPFQAGDPFKPITGKNRADLHIFDIEGIVVSDGTSTTAFSGIGKTVGNVGLINADGYTGYLDAALDDIYPTAANVHPYVLHFDDYSAGNYNPANPMGFESVTTPPPSGNLVMAMGCDYNIQDYVFDISGSIDFIFAVGCTYALSADKKSERFSPVYRIPQHLKKAATEVGVTVVSENLTSGDETSSADLEIKIVDINNGVPVGTALNEMVADSSVGDVSVEVAGVTTSPVSFGSTPVSGTGHSPSDPLIFTGKIYNTSKAGEGKYLGLVKVLDSYPVGQNTSPSLSGADGIKRVDPLHSPMTGTFNIDEFATYYPFSVNVKNQKPIAELVSDPPPPTAFTCRVINFDASGSHDLSGYNIASYEWDWDYTGVPAEFLADDTTTTPLNSHMYTVEGSHITGLRVVNDAPVPQTSDPVSLTHEVVRPAYTDYDSREVHRVTLNDGSTNDIWMPGSNAIVVDNNDAVHVFAHKSTSTLSTLTHYKYDAGTVTSEDLGTFTGYSHQSAVIDSQGIIHVMWVGGTNLLYYSDNSSGSFSAPVDVADFLEGDPYSYSLGINGQDELMFVWQELFTTNDLMGYIDNFGGTWSAPVVLTDTPCGTGQPYSRLAVMVSVNGTPGVNGKDFHCVWTQQFTDTNMTPVVTYSKFDRSSLTWSTPEYAAPGYPHYQDWSDSTVTSDGDVFIASSYVWSNAFIARKDGTTGTWTNLWIAQTSHEEYTSTIGAIDDGTICFAYWERVGYPDPDPFRIKFKVFTENMTQTDLDAITPLTVDPSTTYAYYFGDIFLKTCDFYIAFMDSRDTLGATLSEIYYARIGPS